MFSFEDMTVASAKVIAEWKYGDEYSYCDFLGWKNEKKELMSGFYFAALRDGAPVAFICFGAPAQWQDPSMDDIYNDESFTDIAFGLAPSLCGQGLGDVFLADCIAFARTFFPDDGIRVSVDARNKRALRLYEKGGFKVFDRVHFTSREDIVVMVLP